MTVSPTNCLIATAAFPVFGAICVLVAILMNDRRLGLALTRLSLALGSVCGTVLAILLACSPEPSAPIRIALWKWFSFSLPQYPSITFGLEATWIKAGLIGLTGGLGLIALWNADTKKPKPMSIDVILTTSLLYAAGISFIFAPNLAQALMGWGAVSILAGMLIRLSHQPPPGIQDRTDTVSFRTSSQRSDAANKKHSTRIQIISVAVVFLERVCDRGWQAATRLFPGWLAEQAEVLDQNSVSFQLQVAILGVSAILLTWLL